MKKRHMEEPHTDPFAEYFILGEPGRADKVYAWQTAIGLQDVDRLTPSEYLLNTAKDNIEGDISMEEARKRIESYYAEKDLKNRYLHIAWKDSAGSDKKQPIKQLIKQPIGANSLSEILERKSVSARTKGNVIRLHDAFGNERIFGRGDVTEVLGITERPATALIRRMYELGLTERITGAGKGKYRFVVGKGEMRQPAPS